MNQIKYIKNKDIDFSKWDKCITASHNGNVFGYSWFLDVVCDEWDALIIGNYDAVIPLPIKKTFGIRRAKQSKYLSKINLYTPKDIKTVLTSEFFSELSSKFKMLNIRTADKNLLKSNFKFSENKSYRLDLISSYKNTKENYSDYFKQQIKIAEKNKVFYNYGILPNGLLLLSFFGKNFKKKDENRLRRLSAISLRKGAGEIFGAFNDKNKLIAAVLFIRSHYKINIITSGQIKEAKQKNAIFGLIDFYIKTHSEKALTLDFFGLEEMSLEFYKGFGAKEYSYYNITKKFFF